MKNIGVGYSFKEKNLQKENEELKAKIEKLEKAQAKATKKAEAKE